MKSQVAVPAEFFRGELRSYQPNWRVALAREFLQNSVDAGASRIEVEVTEGDHLRLSVIDDGCGMTEQTLREVFFALGRTTKTGPDTVGGFGRARILTCFAMESYTIATGDCRVEGAGGQYTLTSGHPPVQGARFDLVVPEVGTNAHDLSVSFERLVEMSDLPCRVYVNGSRVSGYPSPSRARRVLRDVDGAAWAKVYVYPDRVGRVLVRSSGLTMYQRYLPGYDDVIVELTPRRAREVLSSSRSGLMGAFGDQLDAFVAGLAGNRRKALRPELAPLRTRVYGGGFKTVTPPREASQVAASSVSEVPLVPTPEVVTARGDKAAEAARRDAAAAAVRSVVTSSGGHSAPSAQLDVDVFMFADTPDGRVSRLARDWSPASWDDTSGSRRRKLLAAWVAAVEVGIAALQRRGLVGEVSYAVGWTFDIDTRADHRKVGDGHVLALNPVGDGTAACYQVSDRTSRQRLLAIALHEVAHVAVDTHDESFAATLTELFATVDVNDADRSIRAAVAEV